MSLQNKLLSLEKKTDKKNRDEAYWKAREESLAEVKYFHNKFKTIMAFLVGLMLFSIGANMIFEKIHWLEIQSEVSFVKERKVSDDDDFFESYVTEYSFTYHLRGLLFSNIKNVSGKAKYKVGENITILADPSNPDHSVIKYAFIQDTLIWLGIGLFFLAFTSYDLFFNGRKKASLPSTQSEKKLQKNPRRGL